MTAARAGEEPSGDGVDPLLDDALGGGPPASPDDMMRAVLILSGCVEFGRGDPEVDWAMDLADRIAELRPELANERPAGFTAG